jgi:Putative porin
VRRVRRPALILRNRAAAALLVSCAAATAIAQEDQPFEPPAFKPHFTFQWDGLARFDDIYNLRVRPDILRGRFEVRPEVGFQFSERLRIGVRAVFDYGTDQNSDNSRNFDNYHSRGSTVQRYYVEAKPGNFIVLAGAFGLPLAATEMFWDHDIQTPGAAVSYLVQPGGASTLTLSAAFLYGPQSQGDQTRIGAGQAIWSTGDPSRLGLQVGVSYWYFDPDDLKLFFADGKPNLIRQNYPNRELDGLLSDYRILDANVRVTFPIGRVPVFIGVDALTNFGLKGIAKEEGDGQALEANLTLGRVGTPGDWRFFYIFQYIEQDALIGAYNTDDWWFHTWYRGHRIGLAYTVLPGVFVQGSFMLQQRLDRTSWLNRILVDLVKMF